MEDEERDTNFNRLGNCEVCGSENAQYTCPRCEVKSCSLNCVKIHKTELNCSGERDKVGFVPMSKYTNLNLLSDYRLLEDVGRTVDNCKRNPLKKYTRFNRKLPPHLYRLRREAFERRTSIQFLPQHFTRHSENTTILNFETGIIHWRLQLIFPQADNLSVAIEKCDENDRLSAVISNFINYDKCPDLYRKPLRFYHSAGLPGLEVLLKAENVKEQPSFFLLDTSSTIKENLENRIIIEYPILFVIFKSHKDEYTILDPDMEIECNLEKEVKEKHLTPFMPYTFFDTVNYSKKETEGDKAAETISSCAAALRKYFACEDSDDELEDKVKNIKIEKPSNTQEHGRKPFKRKPKYKDLDIPCYDTLIKQEN